MNSYSIRTEIPSLPIWSGVSRFDALPPALPIFVRFSRLIRNSENKRKIANLSVVVFCDLSVTKVKKSTKNVCEKKKTLQNNSEMRSKCRKWHLREPKFAKFPGGTCPQNPLEASTFSAKNTPWFPSKRVGISGYFTEHTGYTRITLWKDLGPIFSQYGLEQAWIIR